MIEYALVGPGGEIKTYSRAVKPDVSTKPGWRWLPVERPTVPIDPATEALGDEIVTVTKTAVVVARNARRKTGEELENERQAELEDRLPSSLADILSGLDNRLRALEGKASRSAEEFRNAVLGVKS